MDGRKCSPHLHARGWGAAPAQEEYTDLTRTLEDRQDVGFHPHVSVIAAEKRFQWIMDIIRHPDDGPLGVVEDFVGKKECQKRGSVHWHILFWVKPDTVPENAILGEVPRGTDTTDA